MFGNRQKAKQVQQVQPTTTQQQKQQQVQAVEFIEVIKQFQREFDNKRDMLLIKCESMIEDRLHDLEKSTSETEFINSFNITLDLVQSFEERLLKIRDLYVECAEEYMDRNTPKDNHVYVVLYKNEAYFARSHPMNDMLLHRFVDQSKLHIQQMLANQQAPYTNNDAEEKRAEEKIKQIFNQIQKLPLRLKNDTTPCKTKRAESKRRTLAFMEKIDGVPNLISQCKELGLVDTKTMEDENESILGGKGRKMKKTQPNRRLSSKAKKV